ncbi:MAG: hypothetical protein HFG39_01375 [Lachnospiraceae bacterium]|nr:hypothetical protein [Lachnospiraceae bacterium]
MRHEMEETPMVIGAELIKQNKDIHTLIDKLCLTLEKAEMPELVKEIEEIRENAIHERFTIVVVGEFSRGKSTFINYFLDREFLPVGNLPTTAVMTRIRYSSQEIMAAISKDNKKVFEAPPSQEAWDRFTEENIDKEGFKGNVLIGINSSWLQENDVEFIDTPGAGDLSGDNAKIISDALLGCDGVVIAINANAPLSLSEKLFIEQRLLARKIPFLMIIVTKLDQIPLKERNGIIQYIQAKLKNWNMDIPVFIPYPIELNGTEYKDIIGIDKIKAEIKRWVGYPERVKLTEKWLLAKINDILKNAVVSLTEQKVLLEASDNKKREELVDEKKGQIARAKKVWNELKAQMEQRGAECYKILVDKIDHYTNIIVERLQYEILHVNNAQKWWTEDYPYRIKVELTNMSVEIEQIISKRIAADIQWYNDEIEKTFQSNILIQEESILSGGGFNDFKAGRRIFFEDLDKQQAIAKISSVILTVSGVILFSSMGFLPIIATMGIGTGTAILSDKIFKKKIEEQRDVLKKEIARCVPVLVEDCMAESEARLSMVYQNSISEAEKSEQKWLLDQKATIEVSKVLSETKQYEAVTKKLTVLGQELEKI